MEIKEYSTEVGGKTLTAEFSDLADQASGSVIVRYGNSAVLATVVMSENEREGLDYFPLSVDYEEKFYAAGAILGSRFVRREGRPTEEAILSGRVVDRTIRPLFDSHIRREVQVVVTVLSLDEYDPDVLAINAASLAIATSNIPWNGPVSAVRIGKNGEGFAINPTYEDRNGSESTLDLLACGKDGDINMIEISSNETDEDELNNALKLAVEENEKLQEFQRMIVEKIGKEKQSLPAPEMPSELTQLFKDNVEPKLEKSVFSGAGNAGIYSLKKEWKKLVTENLPDTPGSFIDDLFEEAVNNIIHKEAIGSDKRADGRKMDEVRELRAKAGGISPMIHGTGVFYRGGTHVLSALTLGGPGDSQIIDSIEAPDTQKHFMHHYNFPPFSTGETGRIGGTNRRMVGHGALAEKALIPVIPPKEKFPYTIRIVSEAMASNGSTSMGSVCGSTIALMDAGVPIKKPVAGIAIGLIMDESGDYKILTDIQGPEDHHGDMDFKVAGTREGVTAVQMDVKVGGIPLKILAEAFVAAKRAREAILDVIETEIKEPRAEISSRAPQIITLKIDEEQIGSVIGPGGKVINGIKDETKVEEITIEDDGSVFITGRDGSAEKAAQIIKDMTREYLKGEQFNGEVVNITDFGAFVKITGGKEGLVHVSEIAPFRINNVEEVLSIGEVVPVIIKEVDERDRIKLSIKDVAPTFAEKKGVKPKETISDHRPSNNGRDR
ncbi:MAG: polyribonucleotide nucleotidyltransferase [Candidatus Pacebacteria bacterium]|jgi:polyribonucleotide nucleotidyltransferase|nr:polyribonucleotide nucleotidyltransferase [bacterium]MDP6527493.1 polyribonucleotide nucleotidyltransferase [Candidatus Paceibacterota bacterium]MDP6659855.1 polyribonucleotide nucleotidyltransferase [Candidatus Paceibacterota bacterium]|tara:strand:- start:13189 stop:15354 length:2166 start_codon:yes stop_codon:yes gene_type:complete